MTAARLWDVDSADLDLLMQKEERYLRWRVKLMRELGIVQLADTILGPEPKTPTPLEKLQKQAAETSDPKEAARVRRELRIENARQELRDKLAHIGDDIPNERLDPMLDPAIFELE